jgi:succinate-acetate transporter protein
MAASATPTARVCAVTAKLDPRQVRSNHAGIWENLISASRQECAAPQTQVRYFQVNNPTTVARPADGRIDQWTQAGPVRTVMETTKIAQLETTSEAQIGDTAAMGLFGFCVGTTVLAWIFAGWTALPASTIAVVPMLLVFAGIGQFVAGLYAFNRTHAWAGTALCAYGANYAIIAMYSWLQSGGVLPANHGNSLLMSVDLFCMAYISLALTIGAARLNLSYMLTTLMLVFGYTLVGLQYQGSDRVVGMIGAYFLLAASFFAFYAATGHVVNSTWQREVLPLFSLKRHATVRAQV